MTDHPLLMPNGLLVPQTVCDWQDVDGLCPWPPASLPDHERRTWVEGLRWETRRFHEAASALQSQWSPRQKEERTGALMRVFQVRKTLHWGCGGVCVCVYVCVCMHACVYVTGRKTSAVETLVHHCL